jgi:chloride channel protein, CIC family
MAEATTAPEPDAATQPPPEMTTEQAAAMMRSRRFVVLLVLVSIIGLIVSVISWGYLELIYQIQQELFVHLPHAVGYPHGPPLWWYLPVLAIGALIVAVAIKFLPGDGGHLPARGLGVGGGPPQLLNLPGVLAAGIATIGFGLVLGPEAPLIALGAGVAILTIKASRRPAPDQLLMIIGAAGSFAAISFIFVSPLVAAVILIEATGLGGARLPLVVVPGLLAAGIGSLVALGIGSFTGLSTSAFALNPLKVPSFGHLTVGQFGWTIALALAIAVVTRAIMVSGLFTHKIVTKQLLILLPIVGLIIAGLAIAFDKSASHSVNNVLFDGQAALPGLVDQASTWSLGALALLLVFKGIAYALSLGSYRGGPTFPAVFLGAAAGVMASHLPGMQLTPAVGVGIGAGVACVLRLPISAIVLATLMTAQAGTGDEPLIIVGVVTAFVATLAVSELIKPPAEPGAGPTRPVDAQGVAAAEAAS